MAGLGVTLPRRFWRLGRKWWECRDRFRRASSRSRGSPPCLRQVRTVTQSWCTRHVASQRYPVISVAVWTLPRHGAEIKRTSKLLDFPRLPWCEACPENRYVDRRSHHKRTSPHGIALRKRGRGLTATSTCTARQADRPYTCPSHAGSRGSPRPPPDPPTEFSQWPSLRERSCPE